MRSHRQITSVSRRDQRGAILVTSMLLLLVLTVLGVAMMKATNMQERMAGNTRDLNLALQGAEAALREGEDLLTVRTTPVMPDPTSGVGCLFCNKGALPLGIENLSQFDWSANAHPMAVDVSGLPEVPRYTIELAGFHKDSENVDDIGGRDIYRVTARSTGASGQANTVLQSTFPRRRDE